MHTSCHGTHIFCSTSSKWSCFARREGWTRSTGSSLPPGCAVAPKHTKRAAAPSRGSELGQQTHRSSRGVHSVRGFESPTISMVFRKWNWPLQDGEPFCFLIFFSSLPCLRHALTSKCQPGELLCAKRKAGLAFSTSSEWKHPREGRGRQCLKPSRHVKACQQDMMDAAN